MNPEEIKNYFSVTPSTPLQFIDDQIFSERKIRFFVKRDDLTDEHISGNKFFKLKYNLIEAAEKGYKTLLSFGGAYSNHIYALASAGKRFGFNTIGVIRGEEHLPLNPTLEFAKECGMNFYYSSRTDYRKKYSDEILERLKQNFGEFYLIPEGGSNYLAVKGCEEIPQRFEIKYDYIFCASGTGGTLAGIINGSNENSKVVGVAVLKNASFLIDDVKRFKASEKSNWNILLDYHFGGYSKFNRELIEFVKTFTSKSNIPIEPIYTGKMLFAIYDLARKNFFPEGSTIIAYHSGGLQGLKGLIQRNIW
uniref:1-aminocyclopropane-1-carboxylate deaminase/D-cysteine desulfhydrase n=1 Tax=Ignavibacterium album TaxID=591197 RepID=A0A7V3E846_9BACT